MSRRHYKSKTMSDAHVSPTQLLEEMMSGRQTMAAAIAVILKNAAVKALSESRCKIRMVEPHKTKSVFSRSSVVPMREEKLPPQTREALHNVISRKKKKTEETHRRRAERGKDKQGGAKHARGRREAGAAAEEDRGEAEEDRGEAAEDRGEAAEDRGEAAEDRGEAAEDRGEAEEGRGEAEEGRGEAAAADCSISTDGAGGRRSAVVRSCDRIEAPVALALHLMGMDPYVTSFTSQHVLAVIRSREFLDKMEEAVDV